MKNSQSSTLQNAQLQSGLKFKPKNRLPSESSETMHKGLEISLGCFQPKSLYYGPPYPRSFTGKALELNCTIGGKQASIDSGSVGAVSSKQLAVRSEHDASVQQESYFLKDVHSQSLPLNGCIYSTNHGSFIQTHWVPQVPLQMGPQSYSPDYVFQDFQYFVVIDFEATCDKEKNPHPQEIIEFPSVIVNIRTGQLEDCFQIYVRPTHNQLLTEFCKELTGIQQSQVDKGVILSEALLMHDKWLEDKGIKQTNFAVVTWSNWDCRVLLESECRYKRIRKPPYFNRWINLKKPFNNLYGYARRNLKEAVELAGLTWEGRAHCGLDDAKNTARLLAHIMHRGFKFSITDSLQWQSADHPAPYQQQIPSTESDLAYQPHKWKASHCFTSVPFQPLQPSYPSKEHHVYCFCGAKSIKRVFRKPGLKNLSFLYECGNWTANRGPACSFFKWVDAPDWTKPVWK